MGRDKAALPAGDCTLLAHLVARLGPMVDDVIVAGGAPEPLTGVRWVADLVPSSGPLGGIGAGLRACASQWAWVVGCDLPDVEPPLADLLFAAVPGYEAVVPRPFTKPEGVCAVYDTVLADRIEDMLRRAEHSVMALLARSRVRYLDAGELRVVDPTLRSFRNLNTPDEYAAWLSEARERDRAGDPAPPDRSSAPGR
jgi:molybdenum cofactor guanylyltransferase